MVEEMVMRSVYLRPSEDSQLRQLAHELRVSKSDLIRSAISVKLREWLESGGDQLILRDLKFGRRDAVIERATRADEGATAPSAPARPANETQVGQSDAAKGQRPTSSKRVKERELVSAN